jgi:hypothetical protein
MVKIPKVVRISPHDYYLTEQEQLLKSVELVGQCDNEAGIIRYRSDDMSPGQLRETIVHECLHACVFNAGLKFPSSDDEENFVNKLAPRLYGLMVENPKLIEWVLSDDRD